MGTSTERSLRKGTKEFWCFLLAVCL